MILPSSVQIAEYRDILQGSPFLWRLMPPTTSVVTPGFLARPDPKGWYISDGLLVSGLQNILNKLHKSGAIWWWQSVTVDGSTHHLVENDVLTVSLVEIFYFQWQQWHSHYDTILSHWHITIQTDIFMAFKCPAIHTISLQTVHFVFVEIHIFLLEIWHKSV